MIEKTNITIEDKNTKKIEYKLNLGDDYWWKSEYNAEGNLIYYVSSLWAK